MDCSFVRRFELLEPEIAYKGGYKYQLTSPVRIKLKIALNKPIDIPFLHFENGILTVLAGYAWDGPSGPTIDTPDFMRGSLFHDVLYQLMQGGYLDWSYQELADYVLVSICKKDKMPWFRRAYVWLGVHEFGHYWAKISKDIILYAPRRE